MQTRDVEVGSVILLRKIFRVARSLTTAWPNLIGGAEMRDLPFIRATIRISPYEWPLGTPEPVQTFRDIWVLQDTAAQVSQILSTQLHDNIKKDENGVVQPSGFAVAKVKYVRLLIHVRLWSLLIIFPPRFPGVQQEIEANIAFRPNMPNNTTFIILGQQVSAMQYNASRSRSDTLPPTLLRHCSTPVPYPNNRHQPNAKYLESKRIRTD